jgi:hypothetical protein
VAVAAVTARKVFESSRRREGEEKVRTAKGQWRRC